MKARKLDRRLMLRGLLGGCAVALGLPVLEAMLDETGTVLADGSAIPKKFGMWFFGNGVIQNRWNPTSSGASWDLPPALAALAGVKPYVSVVSKTWIPGHHPTAHWSQWGALRRGRDENAPDGPSADDLIIDHLGSGQRAKCLDVRISRAANGSYTTDDWFVLPGAYVSPHELWQDLFAGFTPNDAPPAPGLVDAKKSVLDAVRDDAKSLRARLGKSDQLRLDAHLAHVESIEQSLVATPVVSCNVPADPGGRPADEPGLREPLEQVNAAMSELVAYALACDLARSFRIHFTTVQCETMFWQKGANKTHHALGHDEPDGEVISNIVDFTVEQLAVLLDRMKSISVGSGNVLDHSAIWVTSEITAPDVHDTWSIPTLLVGKAGGALRGGIHYDAGGNPDGNHKTDVPAAIHSRVLVTLMQALGMQVDAFGDGVARGSGGIAELMT